MNKVLLVLFVVLGVFGGIILAGYKLFGMLGAFGGLVVSVLLVKAMGAVIKNKIINFGKSLFDAKSQVLRDAEVTVHQISAAPKPEKRAAADEEGEEEVEVSAKPSVPTQFFFLDVTIRPKATEGCTPFHCWDSSDLQLVSFDAPAPNMDDDLPEIPESEACQIHNLEFVEEEGAEEGDKVAGAQRLRLHVEVPQALKRLKFQYYFETFGDMRV